MLLFNRFHIGARYSIDEIPSLTVASAIKSTDSATSWRSFIRILVVDDNEFPYATSMKAKGFMIQYETDIDPVAANDYDLILCDQCGVGRKLNAAAEGGSLARAIKRRYPLKWVVLYTSQTKITGFDKGLNELDDIVYSGMDSDDFENKLEEWCRVLMNPIEQWKRFRNILLQRGVSIQIVSDLESDFVRQYKKTGKYDIPNGVMKNYNSEMKDFISKLLIELLKTVALKGVSVGLKMAMSR